MLLLELVTKARELISKPECWTRFTFARDRAGEYAEVHSPAAVCFCSLGAIDKASGGVNYVTANQAVHLLQRILKKDGWLSISGFNDSSTHADVLNLFDKAIKEAKV